MHEVAGRLAGLSLSDEDARAREFEARLSETSGLAFRVAFSVLRNREDAEDVAQDAFVRAHRSFWRLRDRGRFRPWLVRTAWRLALDPRRGDRRREGREQVPPVPVTAPTAEDRVLAGERTARLWRAIDSLPDKLRLTVVLASIEEYPVGEVAKLLRVPPGTVKSRLFEARRLLQ